MKIIINEDPGAADVEIIINCKERNQKVLRMASILGSFDKKLTGVKNGNIFILDSAQIMYFESVDKHTFIYTQQEVYETPLKLYELEENLGDSDFFRSGKSAIINIGQIASLRPDFGGRIEVTMSNGEKLIVSRQYAVSLREKLGLR